MTTTPTRKITLRLKDALPTIEDLLHDNEEFEIVAPLHNSINMVVCHMILTKHDVKYMDKAMGSGVDIKRRSPHVAIRDWINHRLRHIKPDSVVIINHTDPPEE